MPKPVFSVSDATKPNSSVVREDIIEYEFIASEQKLMIMRPYQVYAVQHMVKCIEEDAGNGYVWHTAGSGKTLTSFKASSALRSTRPKVVIKRKADHKYP